MTDRLPQIKAQLAKCYALYWRDDVQWLVDELETTRSEVHLYAAMANRNHAELEQLRARDEARGQQPKKVWVDDDMGVNSVYDDPNPPCPQCGKPTGFVELEKIPPEEL